MRIGRKRWPNLLVPVLLALAGGVCSCQDAEDKRIEDLKHVVWDYRSRIVLSRTLDQERKAIAEFVAWDDNIRASGIEGLWAVDQIILTPRELRETSPESLPKFVIRVYYSRKSPGTGLVRRIVAYEFPVRFSSNIQEVLGPFPSPGQS